MKYIYDFEDPYDGSSMRQLVLQSENLFFEDMVNKHWLEPVRYVSPQPNSSLSRTNHSLAYSSGDSANGMEGTPLSGIFGNRSSFDFSELPPQAPSRDIPNDLPEHELDISVIVSQAEESHLLDEHWTKTETDDHCEPLRVNDLAAELSKIDIRPHRVTVVDFDLPATSSRGISPRHSTSSFAGLGSNDANSSKSMVADGCVTVEVDLSSAAAIRKTERDLHIRSSGNSSRSVNSKIIDYESLADKFSAISQQVRVIHWLNSVSNPSPASQETTAEGNENAKSWTVELNDFIRDLAIHLTNDVSPLTLDIINQETESSKSKSKLDISTSFKSIKRKDKHETAEAPIIADLTKKHTLSSQRHSQMESVYDFKIVQLRKQIADVKTLTAKLSPETVWHKGKCLSLEWSDRRLSGQLPVEIMSLSHLVRLNLNGNRLTGHLPLYFEQLRGLKTLELSHNELTGGLQHLYSHSSLTSLDLSHNRFSGRIPVCLSNLINLNKLDLSHNKLTGGLPLQLGRLAQLHSLFLDNNQLHCDMTENQALNGLFNLTTLKLNDNHLFGSIPISIYRLSNLALLSLNNNPDLKGELVLLNLLLCFFHTNFYNSTVYVQFDGTTRQSTSFTCRAILRNVESFMTREISTRDE